MHPSKSLDFSLFAITAKVSYNKKKADGSYKNDKLKIKFIRRYGFIAASENLMCKFFAKSVTSVDESHIFDAIYVLLVHFTVIAVSRCMNVTCEIRVSE